MTRRQIPCLVLAGLCLSLGEFSIHSRTLWDPVARAFAGRRSVGDAVARYGSQAEQRLRPFFHQASVSYPPPNLTLIGLKTEKRLEVWARQGPKSVFVRSYPIQAASGYAGPKLREGDAQVPEGLYRIELLNPNSNFHLSMRLDYPNRFDQQQAQQEGRTELGGDIFIHGKAISAGCLAMGDDAIEDLFVLVARVGVENVSVILAPRDFRQQPPQLEDLPRPWEESTAGKERVLISEVPLPWVEYLYANLHQALSHFQFSMPLGASAGAIPSGSANLQ